MIDELIDEIVLAAEDVANCMQVGSGIELAKRRLEIAKNELRQHIAFTYEPMPYDQTQLVIPDGISRLQDTLQIIFSAGDIK